MKTYFCRLCGRPVPTKDTVCDAHVVIVKVKR